MHTRRELMILVWNDAKSFRRHLEAMRIFRHSHGTNPVDRILIQDMPTPYDIGLPRRDRLITSLTDARGKVILVPIWKIAVPTGSQN
jgi:hypothetical protein